MGNFLLMETAYVGQSWQVQKARSVRKIILASPDIGVDVFATHRRAIPLSQFDKFTALVSRDDKALGISRSFGGNRPRVGATHSDVLSRLCIRVVDLTQISDESSIQHAKFAESQEIFQIPGERLSEGDTLSTTSLACEVDFSAIVLPH